MYYGTLLRVVFIFVAVLSFWFIASSIFALLMFFLFDISITVLEMFFVIVILRICYLLFFN